MTILKVDGMTCGHCAETVTGAIQKLGGIQSVSVDLEKKEVAVEFDEAVRGPVVIGAGRYFGLGLCVPIRAAHLAEAKEVTA